MESSAGCVMGKLAVKINQKHDHISLTVNAL